jgi:hypothetical protein
MHQKHISRNWRDGFQKVRERKKERKKGWKAYLFFLPFFCSKSWLGRCLDCTCVRSQAFLSSCRDCNKVVERRITKTRHFLPFDNEERKKERKSAVIRSVRLDVEPSPDSSVGVTVDMTISFPVCIWPW